VSTFLIIEGSCSLIGLTGCACYLRATLARTKARNALFVEKLWKMFDGTDMGHSDILYRYAKKTYGHQHCVLCNGFTTSYGDGALCASHNPKFAVFKRSDYMDRVAALIEKYDKTKRFA
jgi:hypothetical protein